MNEEKRKALNAIASLFIPAMKTEFEDSELLLKRKGVIPMPITETDLAMATKCVKLLSDAMDKHILNVNKDEQKIVDHWKSLANQANNSLTEEE